MINKAVSSLLLTLWCMHMHSQSMTDATPRKPTIEYYAISTEIKNDLSIPRNSSFANIASSQRQSNMARAYAYCYRLVLGKRNIDIREHFYVMIKDLYGKGFFTYKMDSTWHTNSFDMLIGSGLRDNDIFPCLPITAQIGDTIYVTVQYDRNFGGGKVHIIDANEKHYVNAQYIYENQQQIHVRILAVVFLAVQLLFIFIQWYFERETIYLYYLGYIATLLYYFVIQYCVSTSITINIGALSVLAVKFQIITMLLPLYFYYKFSRIFLSTAIAFPKHDKLMQWFAKIILAAAALSLVSLLLGWHIESRIIFYLNLLSFVFSIWLIFVFYKSANRVAKYFIWGSIGVSVGHIIALTISQPYFYRKLPYIFHDPHLFTIIGIMIEIILFNMGLSYKKKLEIENRINTQDKLYRELQRNEKLQSELIAVRNNIANDLHDDVGSTLSSISLYGEMARTQLQNNSSETDTTLTKIVNSAQRMLESMNEIIWVIHSKHDAGEDISVRIKNYLADRLDTTGVKYNLHISEEVRSLNLDMYVRRNLILVFKEAVHNAAKYAEAQHVEVSLTTIGNSLHLSIEDDGKGMPEKINFGHGLQSMQERMKKSGGSLEIANHQPHGTKVLAIFELK